MWLYCKTLTIINNKRLLGLEALLTVRDDELLDCQIYVWVEVGLRVMPWVQWLPLWGDFSVYTIMITCEEVFHPRTHHPLGWLVGWLHMVIWHIWIMRCQPITEHQALMSPYEYSWTCELWSLHMTQYELLLWSHNTFVVKVIVHCGTCGTVTHNVFTQKQSMITI